MIAEMALAKMNEDVDYRRVVLAMIELLPDGVAEFACDYGKTTIYMRLKLDEMVRAAIEWKVG